MTGTLYTEHYKRSTFVIKFAYPLSKYDKINTIYFSALLIILDNLDISTGKQSKRLFVSKAFYMYATENSILYSFPISCIIY